jgi:CheY-like chemotaxis protein
MTMARILIVDDDSQVRELLSIMLRFDGHVVEVAQDGIDAIIIYKSHPFDLVITDILMPGKDGIDTICELIALDSKIPLIAMSGGRRMLSSEFNLDSAKLVGAKAILKKPFTDIQLREAIKQAMV